MMGLARGETTVSGVPRARASGRAERQEGAQNGQRQEERVTLNAPPQSAAAPVNSDGTSHRG